MPRVHHVLHARKKNPVAKKGEPYYWWKFRFGDKHFSKTPPRPSQLTQSEFLGTVYGFQEQLEDLDTTDLETAKSERDQIVYELRSLSEEQKEKKSNMPDSLQESDTGQLLESRAEEVNNMADELEGVDLDLEKSEDQSDEDFEQEVESAIMELQAVSYNGE